MGKYTRQSKSSQSLSTTLLQRLKPPRPPKRLRWVTDERQEGLQVGITSAGIKTFYFRFRQEGESVREKLGRWPDLSLDEARDIVRRRLSVKHAGPYAENGSGQTFADAFNAWLNGHAKKTKKTWQEDVRKFNRDLADLHNVPLKELTQNTVERVHGKLGERNGQVHANRTLKLISAVLNYVADKRDDFSYVGPNPCRNVTKFPERDRERYLSRDELQRLSEALRRTEPLYRDLFTVCLFTGARIDNVRSMAWSDIDLDAAIWRLPETKSGKSLVIPLVGPVVETLEARKFDAHPRCKWVFPSKVTPFSHVADCRKAWLRITNDAGLEDVHIHDLRRTMGSWQAQNGVSELVIQKTLGHAPGSKATRVYARLQDDDVRQAVDGTVAKMLTAMKGGES